MAGCQLRGEGVSPLRRGGILGFPNAVFCVGEPLPLLLSFGCNTTEGETPSGRKGKGSQTQCIAFGVPARGQSPRSLEFRRSRSTLEPDEPKKVAFVRIFLLYLRRGGAHNGIIEETRATLMITPSMRRAGLGSAVAVFRRKTAMRRASSARREPERCAGMGESGQSTSRMHVGRRGVVIQSSIIDPQS
jgi:hypothetical protein